MRATDGKQAIGYAVLIGWLCLSAACSRDDGGELYVPGDEMASSALTLVPDRATKTVSATLDFKDLDAIAYVMVRTSGGTQFTAEIDRSELSASDVLTHATHLPGRESFRLVALARYDDG